jgi:hypothetical protein
MGATHGTAASFPIGAAQTEDTTNITGQAALLGSVVEGRDGKAYRLVRADGAVATSALASKRMWQYSAATTYDVTLAVAADDEICGVSVTDQVALADNDHFYLQIDGRCTLIDSGSGVTAGDALQAAATGDGVLEGTVTVADLFHEVTVLKALATAAANADITAKFVKRVG